MVDVVWGGKDPRVEHVAQDDDREEENGGDTIDGDAGAVLPRWSTLPDQSLLKEEGLESNEITLDREDESGGEVTNERDERDDAVVVVVEDSEGEEEGGAKEQDDAGVVGEDEGVEDGIDPLLSWSSWFW